MHKIYNSIGLAYRSRNLEIGSDLVLSKVKKKQLKLVIMSANSSVKTLKVVQNKCDYYGVKLIILNDYEENLLKIFKNKKIKIFGVSNVEFVKLIMRNLEE